MSRILVIRGGAIGDFILTLPAIRLIRENFPDCHLEILGYRHIACLADGRYYANATRSIEYGPLAGFFNPRADLDPELVEYFASFQQVVSYIYDPDGLFESCLRRAGVKNLIAASPKVTDGPHAAHQLAQPLETLALWLEDPSSRFFPSKADQGAADKILGGLKLPLVAMHPGSGGEKKNWPLDNWLEIQQHLLSHSNVGTLLVIGGESDERKLEQMRFLSPEAIYLEKLPLPVLGTVLSRCALFLGHDSGISHLAAAAGARCLLLFGPTDPDIWAPTNKGVGVLQAPEGKLSALESTPFWAKWRKCFPMPAEIILAIDPALRSTGYAVLAREGKKYAAPTYGVIRNVPKIPLSGCLLAIREQLTEIIRTHQPQALAVEGVIYVQSYQTAIVLGAARGAAILAAAERGLPVYEYAPRKAKQAVVGKGAADKQQVAFMVRALLGLTQTPPADAADALAIGITHFQALDAARIRKVPLSGI